MTELYPFLMLPAFDPRPWGTLDLSPIYPHHHFQEKIGEAWLTGDAQKVANGPLRGSSLGELSSRHGAQLTGTAARDCGRFPLLSKFLFPHEKLSVQVHLDDEGARQIGEPCGKTECWYVAQAEPGAQIGLGLKPGTTRSAFEQSIHDNRAEDLLNWIDVFRGEMIYVAGGTVHTLGPGSIIVETQQQSDTTYRLYDYGRPRELHLRQGLAAMKENVNSGKVWRPESLNMNGSNNRRTSLIASPCFVVDRFELKAPQTFTTVEPSGVSSVQILVATEGCGVIEARDSEPVTFAKGDAIVVPAAISEFRVQPQWSLEVLKSYVPGSEMPEPVTGM